MDKAYFAFWPKRLPHSLTVPQTNLYHNLEVSAQRYTDKTAIIYYGAEISSRQFALPPPRARQACPHYRRDPTRRAPRRRGSSLVKGAPRTLRCPPAHGWAGEPDRASLHAGDNASPKAMHGYRPFGTNVLGGR